MFCPNCKAEYRPGFTHCVDCDIDLVYSLDDSSSPRPASVSSSDPDSSSEIDDRFDVPQLLWTGVDTGTFAQIRTGLNEANIPYNDEPLEARLLYASIRNPLEIWVPRSEYEKARKVLAKVYGEDPDEPALPGEPVEGIESYGRKHTGEFSRTRDFASALESPSGGSLHSDALGDAIEIENLDASGEVDTVENFDPEEAILEAWSGTDATLAQMLKDSLRENRIGSNLEVNGDIRRLMIYPVNERHAREIIHEVVDGVPPE
jgi:hypothetical protein